MKNLLIILATLTLAHTSYASTTCELNESDLNQRVRSQKQETQESVISGKLFTDLRVQVNELKADVIEVSAIIDTPTKFSFLGSAKAENKIQFNAFIDPTDDSRQIVVTCNKNK